MQGRAKAALCDKRDEARCRLLCRGFRVISEDLEEAFPMYLGYLGHRTRFVCEIFEEQQITDSRPLPNIRILRIQKSQF